LFAGEEQEKEKPVREIKRERGGERSLNPRPYKAKHNSNARVEHAREEETRITTEREGTKEGKKERKKERKGAPVRRLVRARNINFYEERLGFYVRREAGLKSTLDSPVAPK